MKRPKKWVGKSGIETLQNILDGKETFEDPMGQTLNFALIKIEEGGCVFEGQPGDPHRNPGGNVHGGWAMSILDAAAVLSVVTVLPTGRMCATSTFEIKFARPVKPGMKCRAEGKLESLGTNLAHAKAKLIDIDTGKLLAFCTCTASVFSV